MAVLVMIYGQSGSGKSTSLRNFQKGEVAIFNVSGKPLPFRSALGCVNTDNYETIKSIIKTRVLPIGIKTIVIDDATYLMANQVLAKADIKGYDKWTELAKSFADFLKFCNDLPSDIRVYIIGHTDIDSSGREKFKSYGKMLDDALCTVEARFTIVLKALISDGKHYFETHSNGQDTVKSPMDLFDSDLIDNDLRKVDAAICDYWNIDKDDGGKNEETT